MLTRPILIAYDLTSRSDRVIERCATLGAPLLLAHVAGCDPPTPAVRERLEGLVRADLGDAGEIADIAILHGHVPEAITRFAQERDCRLIATGIASFDSPKDYLLGTTVEEIVQRSNRPVLVVKRRAKAAYQTIIVTTDFSRASAHAVAVATELFPEARVRLLHTCSPPFPMFLNAAEMASFVRDRSEGEMLAFLAAFAPDVRSRIHPEIAVASLDMLLEEHWMLGRCDLLVLSTRGRAGLSRAAMGSRASDLLTRSVGDVLMVREPR